MARRNGSVSPVAVVDVGVICALGTTWETVLESLRAGRSGLVFQDVHGYPTAIGRATTAAPSTLEGGMELDRGVDLALNCIGQLRTLPPLDPRRCAVFWGVGIAGAHWLESSYELYCAHRGDAKTSPWTVPMIMPNAAASLIAKKLGLRGGAWTHASACSSAAMAIGQAFHAIRSGSLDLAVVGGSDSMLTPGMLHAWARMRVLARTTREDANAACKPFDVARNGICLAEGAACLVLMNANLANVQQLEPIAEIHGFGHSCDAYDLTAPNAPGQAQAMGLALQDAKTHLAELSYVCAHATGTQKGDLTELEALKITAGGRIANCQVSSIKSAIGHTMGASGALATALTIGMMQHDWVAPTLHLTRPDEHCQGWRLPIEAGIAHAQLNVAMVNAFGFGGSNASLVLKKSKG
jgi:3-oxoacyl-(acyl-carrier-protein) synthase